jgi:TonB family protein
MNLNPDTSKALRIALLFHGAVICVVVAWSLVTMAFAKPPVQPHIFELQGIKGPQHIGAPGRLAGNRNAPRTDKAADMNLPNLNQSVPSAEPAAPAAAAVAEAPAHAAANSPAAKPKSNAKTVTNKGTTQQVVNYKDFAKTHKLPGKNGKGTSAKGGTTKGKAAKGGAGASINAAAVVSDLRNNLAWGDGGTGGGGAVGGTGITSGEMDELGLYFQRVRELIDSNFEEPHGVVQQVHAMVQFTILANGTVTGVSVVSSSGSEAFDSASSAAVTALGRLDPPPGNQSYTRKIEFVGKREGE